ncbi:MAG: hypothetical protein KDK54_03515 [Leptospiraceae bacterium]|nr:hypothetical protein [Leptospiraceae bacterium]
MYFVDNMKAMKKFPMYLPNIRVKNLSVLSVVLFLSLSISAQEAGNPDPNAPDKQGTGSAPTEDKPLLKETGTVTVDPQLAANTLKVTNLRALKKLKSSFYNYGESEKYGQLMKGYVEATITLSERKYLDARRKFQQNQVDINESAKGLFDKYKEKYTKLYADFSFVVVDLKINTTSASELGNSSYEKFLASANEYNATAQEHASKNNYVDAIYAYKNAILNLVRVPYFVARNKSRNMKLGEKVAKNIFLDEDFVPKENLIDYDDSLYRISEEREKERTREREAIKSSISSKLGGDIQPDPLPAEEKKEGAPVVDKTPEAEKDKEVEKK